MREFRQSKGRRRGRERAKNKKKGYKHQEGDRIDKDKKEEKRIGSERRKE